MDASSAIDAADAAATSPRDAGTFDAAPLPVVCASQPCARSLVTTLGTNEDERAEGFCALLDDGAVACWGANGAGQLGRGEDGGLVDSANAAKVVGLPHVVSLEHTCAVDDSGGVWCWGSGPFRWSDAGAVVTTETTPVKLDLPAATKVALGFHVACAVIGGEVSCWGDNANGQLGSLTETFTGEPQRAPLPTGAAVRGIDVGNATFVLREDGSLVTWGGNPGIGRVSPSFPDPYPQLVALEGVTTTDSAYDNTCATANGIGYCWGAPLNANDTVVDRALPEPVFAGEPLVQIATTRTLVASSGVVERYRWCGVADSGSVFCWGFNESGQAGNGAQDYVLDAVKVDGLPEPATQVKTTPNTTCALVTSGKIYCWGGNYNGQLGNGQNRGRTLVPTEVVLP